MHRQKSRPSNRAQMHDANAANEIAKDFSDWPTPASSAEEDEDD